ncbi:hypothetical protein CFIICLFH_4537 [Methylobacterium goesingense]|nr:hypothetical protein CFIICLFH_4537 [Methylobacterium goesingense]
MASASKPVERTAPVEAWNRMLFGSVRRMLDWTMSKPANAAWMLVPGIRTFTPASIWSPVAGLKAWPLRSRPTCGVKVVA